MNYMPEVAKLLGVEIGEEFEIIFPNSECHATAILNNCELYIKKHNLANQDGWQMSALKNLLNGTYKIKLTPWKPKYGGFYYHIDEDGYVYSDEWRNESIDINFYKLGNCYQTAQEAENNSEKWIEFYKSDEVLEI